MARSSLDTIELVAFGWGAGVFALIAGYYVLRYRLRRMWQSASIAALALGWILASAAVGGVLPHTAAVVLVLCGNLFGTIFLLGLLGELRRGLEREVSELRRGGARKPRGEDVD